jgi:uncharacterized membrane protein YoaK (UPF0700 family)
MSAPTRGDSPAAAVLAEAARTLRPAAGDRHGPLLPAMVGLTLVTGIVDAASYLRLGHVFVANMTGNVVFLGFALAGAAGVSAVSSLVAIGAFLAGALCGGRLAAGNPSHRGLMLRTAGCVQVTLIAAALVLALALAAPLSSGARYALLVPLALSMGVQNATAQRLSIPELTTTVLTRTLTGLASEARIVGGPGAKLGRRLLAVVAMLLGALAGGLLALHVSVAAAIGLAAGLVALVTAGIALVSRRPGVWTEP